VHNRRGMPAEPESRCRHRHALQRCTTGARAGRAS